jgi:hypothetical protein
MANFFWGPKGRFMVFLDKEDSHGFEEWVQTYEIERGY